MAEKYNNQSLTLWVSQTTGFLITNALLLVSYTLIRISHATARLLPAGYLILGLGVGVGWALLGAFSAKVEEVTGPAKKIRILLCYIIPIIAAALWLVALIVYLVVKS